MLQQHRRENEIFALSPLCATSNPGEYRADIYAEPIGTACALITARQEANGGTLALSVLGDRIEQPVEVAAFADPARLDMAVQTLIARYLNSPVFETRALEVGLDVVWDMREAA